MKSGWLTFHFMLWHQKGVVVNQTVNALGEEAPELYRLLTHKVEETMGQIL